MMKKNCDCHLPIFLFDRNGGSTSSSGRMPRSSSTVHRRITMCMSEQMNAPVCFLNLSVKLRVRHHAHVFGSLRVPTSKTATNNRSRRGAQDDES